MGDFLELNGYTVQTARDGAGAHALMRDFEPDSRPDAGPTATVRFPASRVVDLPNF